MRQEKGMLRGSRVALHGPLKFPIGHGTCSLGVELMPMLTSNHIYYDPAKLRKRLDDDGYLFFKGMIPKDLVEKAFEDVANQLIANKWLVEADLKAIAAKDGFVLDLPFPSKQPLPPPTAGFKLTQNISDTIGGANVMTVMRQVLSGGVELLPRKELEIVYPGEVHGFHMDNIFQSRGTKLVLTAWVPLHTITLSHGPIVVAKGSNHHDAYKKIRQTYGAYDIEAGDVHGDGSFTMFPSELIKLSTATVTNDDGDNVVTNFCPLVTSAFEPGDIVITTCLTMTSFLTNTTNFWRLSGETKWIMEGDDVGPDPRYIDGPAGEKPVGVDRWAARCNDTTRYPRSMVEAKKAWGLVRPDEAGGAPSGNK